MKNFIAVLITITIMLSLFSLYSYQENKLNNEQKIVIGEKITDYICIFEIDKAYALLSKELQEKQAKKIFSMTIDFMFLRGGKYLKRDTGRIAIGERNGVKKEMVYVKTYFEKYNYDFQLEINEEGFINDFVFNVMNKN